MATSYAGLENIMRYDPLTGHLILTKRLGSSSKKAVGDILGNVNSRGYIYVNALGHKYKAHRVIYYLVTGTVPDSDTVIDHINGNTSDNRLCNLRFCTHADNMKNCKRSKNNTSGTTGVYWYKNDKRWIAAIQIDTQKIYLGSFVNYSDAVNARKNAEVLYGFHENHDRVI